MADKQIRTLARRFVEWREPLPEGRAPVPEPAKAPEPAAQPIAYGNKFQQTKTHCPHGHAYTPENTKLVRSTKPGKFKRQCRACHRLRGTLDTRLAREKRAALRLAREAEADRQREAIQRRAKAALPPTAETIEHLESALALVTRLLVDYGDPVMPLFEKLERELAVRRAKAAPHEQQ